MSGELDVCNLVEIIEALTSVVDIWLRLQSVGTDKGAGEGVAEARRNN